jgi:hypothetical protein
VKSEDVTDVTSGNRAAGSCGRRRAALLAKARADIGDETTENVGSRSLVLALFCLDRELDLNYFDDNFVSSDAKKNYKYVQLLEPSDP